MGEAFPADADPFAPVVELPERCICNLAINCVGALAAARRECGRTAGYYLDMLGDVKKEVVGRTEVDPAAVMKRAGHMSSRTVGRMLDVIEQNEAVVSAALGTCPGFRGGCGLSESQQADLRAIASRVDPTQ